MPKDLDYLLESYRAGTITRREFIQRALLWTGSVAVASSLLDSLSPADVYGNQVDPNDPALISADVKYPATDGASIGAYVTRPKTDGRRPAVIVVSDNGALDDHNRDIGRRLAKAGYVAIVPDVVSREGGTSSFPNREAVGQAIAKLTDDNVMKDLMGAQNYIKGQSFVQASKIGVVGFCWGGGKTFLFTTQNKDLAASVIYYGPIPQNLDSVKNISAPVLGNYGELDKAISSQVPRLAEEMQKYGKSYDYKIYPDAPHAFNSDTRPDRYRPEAAKDAWGRTLEFFFQETSARLASGSTDMVTRREFLQRSVLVTGSLAAGKLMVDPLVPVISHAAQVDPNDPGLTSSEIKYPSTDGTAIGGYVTLPKGDVARPAVMVIHAWSGIDDHTRDVGRRFAKAGYAALVPDLLSRQGGTSSFASREAAIAAGRKLDDEMIIRDLNGGINYLKGQKFVRADRVGVIGFCWGGGKALLFTTRSKDLAASVIYYGENPRNLEDANNITAPVLGHYGGDDERITSAVPQLVDAMKKYGKSFEYKVYPGAPHGFNSDTSPQNYREDAAKEAWDRTLEFFKKHLQG